MINLINKETIRGDDGLNGDSRAAWTVRLWLFIGLALMAGGLAGSVVRHLSSVINRKIFLIFFFFTIDGTDSEIYLTPFPPSIHVLWICQRFAERRAYAFSGRTLDSPEY